MRKYAGFTLIELLVVIGIIGVLASIVIIAVNPVGQLAQARDSGRKSSISQLATAALSYNTTKNLFPTSDSTWVDTLIAADDLKAIPNQQEYNVTGTSACTVNNVSGYCYLSNSTDAIIYTRLEAPQEAQKCTVSPDVVPYFLWSSKDGKVGVICATSADPTSYNGYMYN